MPTPNPKPDNTKRAASSHLRQKITKITYATLTWGRDHVPTGVRTLLGVLFMIGGLFGFLPILGFWMLPLGVAFVALDLPFTRHHIERWIEKLRLELQQP